MSPRRWKGFATGRRRLRVTVFVALLVFLDVVATVCTGGIGRLAFFASMVSTCRYSASRLSASLSVLPRMADASASPLLISA